MPIALIDGTLYSAQPLGQNDASYAFRSSFCGPVSANGNLYLVLQDNQSPSATFDIWVYKSTDNGDSWSQVPVTPPASSIFYPWISISHVAPRIWCLYATQSGPNPALHVAAFNTTTELWEAPIDVTANSSGSDTRIWDMTVQSDGTITVVYTLNVSATFNVWYVRYTGSWGTHTQISSSDGTAHCGIFLDTVTDTTHVFYTGRDATGVGPLRATLHRSISSTGVLSADTQLLPAPGSPNNDIYPTFGSGCVWNDRIIVPYNREPGRIPAVFVGTPVSNPVWSSTDLPYLDPGGHFNTFEFAHLYAVLDGSGNLNVFWGAAIYDAGFDNEYPTLLQSVNTGSGFANAVKFYDLATDPPTPNQPNTTHSFGVFMPSVAWLSSAFGVALQIVLNTTGAFGYNAQPELYTKSAIVPPPPLAITCGGSPPGEVGTPYSNALGLSGGVPPYTVTIISGSLPPGLSLNSSTGLISGTPTLPGTYTFLAFVADNVGSTAQIQCSIVITSSLLITCGNPPNGTVGLGYQTIIPVSGGVPPYVLSIVAGSLPTGLTLDPNTGIIGGTPTQAGTFTFTVSVADTNLTTANVVCSITIGQVSAGCTSLQSGTVGVPYSQAFQASGGTAPYAFAVIAGQLPFGLTLDPNTGVLSGTPLVLGTYQVTIQVTDANGVTATVVCIHIIGCQ